MKLKSGLVVGAIISGLAAGTAMAGDAKTVDKVGISVGTLGNPFYVATAEGITSAAKALNPDVDITAVSADYDLNKQLSQIDSFIGAGMQIMMIVPVDPQASVPSVQKAKDAGLVVGAFDAVAPNADINVTTNNVRAGEIACQYMADRLNGKGDVVIVNAIQVSAVVDRVNGCKSVLDKYEDINIIADQASEGSRDTGMKVMQSLLTRFPHIDGVFALNDPAAIGADLAAKQLNRSEFFIVSVDGAPDVQKLLESGNTLIAATAAQDPYAMAAKAFELANDVYQGKTLSETNVLMDPMLVTADNVADYVGWEDER
ncbi:ABC transporter substrate-binding protein [Martelella mediterranea]|uniref:Monosaccharide ABC transporter substrate-binding protein (CUT2 family) n=1 Tax=Martelella mediterranea TaxID=293089 RepID=A0A4R3NKU7_9HYPH|nr:ABC transporter substrate-binding protein [Martelella mediterranea]TCT34747.1 monosaccharide ABC transporter substrate-binding protein (CUT2 family) [Martelella mediterranea]